MTFDAILTSIDEQIAKLQQARTMLSGGTAPVTKKAAGRPKKVALVSSMKQASGPKKRVMSAEARARIAAAQKKRWAAAKKIAK